jgi:hypothetical protein
MTTRISVTVLTLAFAVCFVAGAQADRFSFSTGSPDGKLGALSRPSGQGLLRFSCRQVTISSDRRFK